MGKRRAPDLMASGLRAVGTTTSMLVWRRYKRAEPPKMLTLRNAAGWEPATTHAQAVEAGILETQAAGLDGRRAARMTHQR